MAAIAGTNVVGVILHLHQISPGIQIGNNLLAGFIAIQTLILAAELVDNTLIVQDPNHFQIMTQTDFKVIGIMGRSHLDAAGAEFHFGIVIRNHRDFLVHQRQNNHFANNILVAIVIGVNAHAGVAKHSLRAGGSNDHFPAAICQRIPDMPQMTGLIHVFHFCV